MTLTRMKKIGLHFDRRIQQIHAASLSGGMSLEDHESQIAEIDAIATPILNMRARTIDELALKARVALWLCGDQLSDETPAEAAAATIIRDLIALDRANAREYSDA